MQTWNVSDNLFTYIFRGKHNLNKFDTREMIGLANETLLYEEIKCVEIKFNRE